MKHFVVIAALALSAATGAARADTNLLMNGSFEQPGPNFVAGSFCYLGSASQECGSLPSWSGAMPVIKSGSNAWDNPSGLSGWDNAQGNVLIGLQNASYAVQNVGLTAGSYSLSWRDAGRASYDSARYTVSFGGQDLSAYSTTPGQGWATHTLAVTATGAGDLRFQGLQVSPDGTAFIDDVRLTAALPEPASLALVLAGLLGIGFVARRRAA